MHDTSAEREIPRRKKKSSTTKDRETKRARTAPQPLHPSFPLRSSNIADLNAHARRRLDLIPTRGERAPHALPDVPLAQHDEDRDDEGEQPQQQHRVAPEGRAHLSEDVLQVRQDRGGAGADARGRGGG